MFYLEHANITVHSIARAQTFLKAAFPSFKIRGSGSLHGDSKKGRWCHFGDDRTYIALQENAQHASRSDIPYLHDGINHLGFVVTDLDAAMGRIEAAGFVPSPVSALDSHPHRRRVYYVDENQFEWELVEYLSEEVSQRNDYLL